MIDSFHSRRWVRLSDPVSFWRVTFVPSDPSSLNGRSDRFELKISQLFRKALVTLLWLFLFLLTSRRHHPHPAPLMSRCQIENTETVNLRGSEWIIQQQLSRYCCHRDQRYVQRFLSPCNDASSRACFWTPVTTAGRSQSQHLTWWPHSCLCVAWREGWSVCFRLTSNLPMEAVVWLVCITSVRAHICWILDDTVWGSGRPWRQTGGRMSSRGRAEGQTTS